MDRVLVDHIFVRLGVALDVGHVPAKGCEEWINELTAKLGLVVLAGAINVLVAPEPLDKLSNLPRNTHNT